MTRAARALDAALGAVAALVGLSFVVLAAAHVDDRYRVDFVSGTWLALADYATSGTLFPPEYHDGALGGTRYMPLPVLLDAAAIEITGDLLVGAKLATYVVAVALVAVAFAVLRQVDCPPFLSVGLIATALVTPTGLVGTLGLRNDALAVVLQLAAVAVVLRAPTRVSAAVAGGLAAAAIFAKVSAVWAAIAIAVWLVANRRAVFVAFAAAFAATAAVAMVVFELVSDGRFLSQVTAYTFAGGRGPAALVSDGPQAVVTNFVASADAVWLLFPIAVLAVVWRLRRAGPTLLQTALAVDLVVVTVVMSSRGTDHNHLLDLTVLTALVVGELAGARVDELRRVIPVLVGVAVLWGVATSYVRTMGPETKGGLRSLVRGSETGFETRPLAGLVDEGDTVLSEDPTIPLLLGQRPLLLDSFIARAAMEDDPEVARAVAARVAAKEFDAVILVAALEPGTGLYDKQFLGRTVNDALRASYRIGYVERDLYVYVPTGGDSS